MIIIIKIALLLMKNLLNLVDVWIALKLMNLQQIEQKVSCRKFRFSENYVALLSSNFILDLNLKFIGLLMQKCSTNETFLFVTPKFAFSR